MSKDTSGPAFPTQWVNDGDQLGRAPDGQIVPAGCSVQLSGMTLRDYFAAHAPAEPQPWFMPSDDSPINDAELLQYDVSVKRERYAQWPWAWADAMLTARSGT